MRYEGTVYRPPSEARSLIIQMTIGCARNTCTFCEMYKDKQFRVRSKNEVVEDLLEARELYKGYKIHRIFLADGDALIAKTEDIIYIFEKIHEIFPEIERITMYGAPKDILGKTIEELELLHDAGLDMVYMGIESGDDKILYKVKKGVTAEEMTEAGRKLKKASIQVSATLISGLGGRRYFRQHAIESAKVISAIKPEYLGFLTLMVNPGVPMYEELQRGDMELLEPDEVIEEMRLFLNTVDSEGTVFRSNHASNYVALGGNLNADKELMLKALDETEKRNAYRPEGFRNL